MGPARATDQGHAIGEVEIRLTERRVVCGLGWCDSVTKDTRENDVKVEGMIFPIEIHTALIVDPYTGRRRHAQFLSPELIPLDLKVDALGRRWKDSLSKLEILNPSVVEVRSDGGERVIAY